MPVCQITLRCKGNKSPFNGCFRHPELQGLSIKNYDYKQINAWQVFPLSVTKIRIISHNATFFVPNRSLGYIYSKSPTGNVSV